MHANNRNDLARLLGIEETAGRTFDLRKANIRASDPAIRRLVRTGYVVPVGRGVYTVAEHPRPQDEDGLRVATAPFEDEPYYVSWRAALSRHELTEQDPRTVAVATLSRKMAREIGGLQVRPVLQSKDRFYGFDRIRVPSGATVNLATPEKAIIDSLDRPDLGGGIPEVAKALNKTWAYSPEALVRLARRYPSKALAQRLGYLMTVLGVGDPSPLLPRVRRKGRPALLDLVDPAATASLDSTWRVIDNVGPDTLRAWADR